MTGELSCGLLESAAMQVRVLLPRGTRTNPISRLRTTLAAGLAVAGLVALSACRAESRDRSGHRVVVLGVDGATWDVIDPLMAQGELPNFRRLVDRGARADLIVLPPLTSPVVWTTYATGTFSRRHHILDFLYPYVDGEKHPVESTLRREPAIWSVASEQGRSVAVVGYYVTHPAEIVDGVVVSDTSLRSSDGTTYPTSLAAELDLVGTPEERQRAYRRFLPWSYDPRAADDPASPEHAVSRIVRGRIDGAIVADENVRRNAFRLLDRGDDLFMTYLRIVDHASHSTWRYYDDSELEEKADPEGKRLLGDLIPEAYRFVDEFLGEVMARVGKDANVILISDHGFGPATGAYAIRDERFADILSGNHRHDGILLAAGPDIQPGTYEGVAMTDVAPLILALLGLPISDELPGRVPDELLADGFESRHPRVRVPAYNKRWSTVVGSGGVDEHTMDQLKALGYVASSTPSGRGATEEVDYWRIDLRLRQGSLLGELLFDLMRGKTAEADRLMALVREKDPDLAAELPRIVRSVGATMQKDFPFTLFPDGALDSLH